MQANLVLAPFPLTPPPLPFFLALYFSPLGRAPCPCPFLQGHRCRHVVLVRQCRDAGPTGPFPRPSTMKLPERGSVQATRVPSILNRYLDFCIPPGWSKKLSNRTFPFKIGFSRPGTPRNRFVLKFCVVWYLQNRIWLEKCLKSATFDFWPSGVRYLSCEISIRNGS